MMKKEDIIRKLTSRKLWAAVGSVVIALCVLFGVNELKTEQIVALISAVGALIAYIFGEGIVDAARLKTTASAETVRQAVTDGVEDALSDLLEM